jgi:hypothetical protein
LFTFVGALLPTTQSTRFEDALLISTAAVIEKQPF